MELTKPHQDEKKGIYAQSVPADLKHLAIADQMVAFMDAQEKEWADVHDRRAWAIAHCQVSDSETPLRIFTVHPLLIEEGNKVNAQFPDRRIFNAEIIEAPTEIVGTRPEKRTVMNEKTGRRELKVVDTEVRTPNMLEMKEGCMSFIRRTPKYVKRLYRVKVKYQYPVKKLGIWRLKTVEEYVEGLKAQVFQHEIEHFSGSNIYYGSSTKR